MASRWNHIPDTPDGVQLRRQPFPSVPAWPWEQRRPDGAGDIGVRTGTAAQSTTIATLTFHRATHLQIGILAITRQIAQTFRPIAGIYRPIVGTFRRIVEICKRIVGLKPAETS